MAPWRSGPPYSDSLSFLTSPPPTVDSDAIVKFQFAEAFVLFYTLYLSFLPALSDSVTLFGFITLLRPPLFSSLLLTQQRSFDPPWS